MRLTPPRNLPAPGRRQTLYVALRLEQSPVFLVNSRLGRFTATPRGSERKVRHPKGHSFSRSYGVIMPSSLTIVLPIALVCSTRLPVSVLVRAPQSLLRGFSRKHGLTDFTLGASSHVSGIHAADFHAANPTRFHGDVQNPAPHTLPRHPIGDSAPRPVREYRPVVHRLRLPASP